VETGIRVAHSLASQPRQAVEEFHAAAAQPDAALVLFFCSNRYDLAVLAQEIAHQFSDIPVVGCTTAGEIGPSGYCEGSLVGASFSADICMAATAHVEPLQQFEVSRGQAVANRLLQELEDKTPQMNPQNSFALCLIDGLSVREEPVARAFQTGLGTIPVVGGSAGDGLDFGSTYVYADGAFRSDSAVLTLITTPLPFKVFKTQHFVATDRRLVITEADSEQRIVKEINGLPAAQEYAHVLDADVAELDPSRFAASPVVVLIDGNNYVRSIQKINEAGSIKFFCAIEEGVVLRLARGVDLVENLEHAFGDIRKDIGPPDLVIGFDCILRRLEIMQGGMESHVGDILREHKSIGFSTYGEQFRGIHVNQTLTGVALGTLPPEEYRG